MSDNADKKSGLNLLSLDGGGITGLSSLLIIKELMTRLGANGKRGNIPKPCEHFDMIAGIGTGAISVVMLGRLGMSIDDAITSYLQLMKAVFSDRKTQETIHRVVGNENEKMVEGKDDKGMMCKVVVYAMSAYNATPGLPVAFRSYCSSTATTRCAIWEALRATTAHPEMFKSIEVDVEGTGIPDLFTHGGLGCTNPTARLLEEARHQYPDHGIASIISIGAGHPKAIHFTTGRTGSVWAIGGSMMAKVMQAARKMAEGSERVAEEMVRRFADVGSGYYRLNIQQGTQGVEASEWEQLSEIASHRRSYLDQAEPKSKLDELVKMLSQRAVVLEATQIGELFILLVYSYLSLESDGRVVPASEPVPGSIRSYPPSSICFTGREKCTKQVRKYFTHKSRGRFIFVLYGLGGAGKTQIALKCIEGMKEWFKHVMFIDASSDKSIQASLATIALNNNIGKTYEDMLNWIGGHSRNCLVVLDNADDPRMNLRTYLPGGEDYNVLITTRCREFAALAEDSTSVYNVSGLEHDEAVELLLRTAKLAAGKRSEEDKAAIDKLLKASLVSLVQAGAYIWNMPLSISQYWEKYSESRQKVFEGGLVLNEYAGNAYTTWELSLNQLSPYAKELLFFIAFLHRDEILEETFQ
ncbi:P-loop containing nucleoside triphosphate hydrolase protein [Rhizoctonia solani]|nr:P-loop containing nucleoside triphosphate hydrolase protein [Rhizoctonia solani]